MPPLEASDGVLGSSPEYPVGMPCIKPKVPQTHLSGLDGYPTGSVLQGLDSD